MRADLGRAGAECRTVPDDETGIRLVRPEDAPELAAHLACDAEAFARWEPDRPEAFYTAEGQLRRIERQLEEHRRGGTWPGVVVAGDAVIGQVTSSGIVRGPFRKGSVGYWVATPHQGRGHARRAVGLLLRLMAGELDLHRAEASTQLENLASQRVLRANGFSPYGVAHAHILLQGAWRDGLLWERTLQA